MAYGVKVEAKIEVAKVDGEALRKAIQNSLDSVTKDNPIVISKFSARITKEFGENLRVSVQKTLDDSLSNSPIRITKFTGEMLAGDRDEIIKKVQNDFKNQNVEINIKSFNTKDAVNKLRSDLATMLSGLTVEGVRAFLGTEGTEEAYNKAASAAEKLAEAEGKIKKKNEESVSALQRLQALRTSASGTYRNILNIDDDTIRSDLSNQYADLFKQIERARTLSAGLREQEISDIEETIVRLKAKAQAHIDAAKEAQRQAKIIEKAGGQEAYDAKQAAKAAEEHERAVKKENEELNRKIRLKMQIQSWTEKETKAYNRYRKEIDALLTELNGEGKIAPSRLEEISLTFNKIKDTASRAGVSGKAFFNVMKDGMTRLLTWTTIYAVFSRMTSYVIELDAAMTELKKVTNLTSKEYDSFLNKSSGVAREVGASIADTVNATADFARLGFGIEDASDLAEAALIYKNVGDGITNISFATESLISTIKAFNIEASDSMDIVDKFNEVGNNFAISSAGIGEALKRSASALASAGNTIDESIALIVAANSVVQDPEVVGTAMKTISMYIRAAKTEAEEAGIATDGMATSIASLREEMKQLTGVDIMINDTTFKSTYQIIKEISMVWKDLSGTTQANVTNLLGGKRNANVITSLIENFSDATAVIETLKDAAGSAATENAKFLDSVNGQLKLLKTNFEALSSAIINSDLVKNALKFINMILESLVNIEEHTNLVTIALAAMAGGVILKRMNMLKDFLNGMKFLGPTLKSLIGLGGATSAASGSLALATSVPSIFVNISAAITPLIPVIRELAIAFALLYGGYKVLYDMPYQKEIQHANDLRTAYESSTDTYKKNLKTIESLSARYYQLSKGVADNGENISLTADEYKEYRGIIDSIARISPTLISSYTEEGAVLKSYTDIINDAKDAQRAYAEETRRAYLESGKSQFAAWKEQYEDTKKDIMSAWNDLGDSVYAQGIGSIGKNQNIWRDALKNIGWDIDVNDVWGRASDEVFRLMYDNSNVFLYSIEESLRTTGQYTEESLQRYMDSVRESMRSFRSAYSDTVSIISEEANFLFDRIRMDDGNIIDAKIPIEAFDELKAGIQGVIDPTKSYADNLLSVNSYIRDFARIIESDAGKNISSMTEGLKTGEVSIEDYNSALNMLREEFGDNSAIVAAIEYFASFTDTMRNAGDQTEETAKQISGLSVVLKRISTSRSILEKARDDMKQYGSLQRDTIQSLYDSLGEDEDINKYLTVTGDLITLNETDWLERQRGIYQSEIDAYEDANKEYIKRRDELISQINAANAYINQTDGYDTLLYADSNEASSALIQYQDELSSVNAEIEKNNGLIIINTALLNTDSDAFDKLTDSISKIEDMSDLIGTVRSEIKDTGENSLSTLSKFISQYGKGWDQFVDFSDGIKISDEAISALIEKQIMAMDITEQQRDQIRKAVEADLMKKSSTDKLKDSYSNLKSVMSSIQGSAIGAEITYDAYQSLIDQDVRYTAAIEYQNGVLTVNRTKFDEITNAIMEENQALALQQIAILESDEKYRALIERKQMYNDLNEDEIAYLNGIEAQIMGWAVLASEIDNANSALERFKNADSEVGDSSYNTAIKAAQMIDDVLNNKGSEWYGRIGEEKFIEAKNLLIRPDVDMSKAQKTIERYFTEDGSGVNRFLKDLKKNGFIDANNMLVDTTLDAIGQKLGLTEEAVRALFAEYNTYVDEVNKIDIKSALPEGEAKKQNALVSSANEAKTAVESVTTSAEAAKKSVEDIGNTELTINTASAEESLSRVSDGLNEIAEKIEDISKKNLSINLPTTDEEENVSRKSTYKHDVISNRDSRIIIEITGDGNTLSEIPIDEKKYSSELRDAISDFNAIIKEARDLGIDLNKTIYGNVDTNNRQILEWTEENLERFKEAYESWGYTSEELAGSISTVIGTSEDFDGVEIAFTPILQTSNGPKLLDADTVYEYIWGLIDKANEDGSWTDEELLSLDVEGLEFDGQIIKNLLAGIGEEAFKAGEAMHFVGKDGAVEQSIINIEDAASKAGATIVKTWRSSSKEGSKFSDVLDTIIDKTMRVSSNAMAINTPYSQGGTQKSSGSIFGMLGKIFGISAASGTDRTIGGKTLVGEVGREIVVDPSMNRWYTVGDNGAEFVNLPKNAIVFNAKQTEELLSSGHLYGHGDSMASGNAGATGILSSLKNAVSGVVSSVVNKITGSGKNDKPTGPDVNMSAGSNTGNRKSSGGGSGSKKEKEVDILEEILKKYQEINGETQHLIDHQRQLYKEAERAKDFGSMEKSLLEQIRLQKQLMADSQKGIDELRKNGATEADKELQDLENDYWDAYNSIYDALEEINNLYIDGLNDKIDGIQNAISTLQDAASELSNDGAISTDTFQELLEHGIQYMSLIEKVGDRYVINKDAVNDLVNAEREQLAVESAISYLSQIQQALTDGNADAVANLINLNNQIGQSTWAAVYAQAEMLKTLGLTDDQYNQIIASLNAMKEISENVSDDLFDENAEFNKAQKEAIDYILKKTQELIKYETNERIDAIKDEIDGYKKIVSLKKEALRASKEENDYQKSVAEKTKEIAKLQAKIGQLSLDDSREAAAKRAELTDELAKLQEELGDTQNNRANEITQDMLDKQAEQYEEERQKEIDSLNEKISSTEKLYQEAINRLETGWNTIYSEIINWNTEAGSTLNSEITENWNIALRAAQEYGSYINALRAYESGNGVQMPVAMNKDMLPIYHDGGVVGNKGSINGEEAIALLEKGEVVVSNENKSGLFRMIDFVQELSNRLGKSIGDISKLSAESVAQTFGYVRDMNPQPIAAGSAGNGMTFSPVIHVQISHNGNMTDGDAERYGKRIADSALDRLYRTFVSKGVGSSGNNKLRT